MYGKGKEADMQWQGIENKRDAGKTWTCACKEPERAIKEMERTPGEAESQ